ncbi:MAG: hypothetical protein WC222_08265 [Parachlamydiales bacterium]|jgi:hypothetical protein
MSGAEFPSASPTHAYNPDLNIPGSRKAVALSPSVTNIIADIGKEVTDSTKNVLQSKSRQFPNKPLPSLPSVVKPKGEHVEIHQKEQQLSPNMDGNLESIELPPDEPPPLEPAVEEENQASSENNTSEPALQESAHNERLENQASSENNTSEPALQESAHNERLENLTSLEDLDKPEVDELQKPGVGESSHSEKPAKSKNLKHTIASLVSEITHEIKHSEIPGELSAKIRSIVKFSLKQGDYLLSKVEHFKEKVTAKVASTSSRTSQEGGVSGTNARPSSSKAENATASSTPAPITHGQLSSPDVYLYYGGKVMDAILSEDAGARGLFRIPATREEIVKTLSLARESKSVDEFSEKANVKGTALELTGIYKNFFMNMPIELRKNFVEIGKSEEIMKNVGEGKISIEEGAKQFFANLEAAKETHPKEYALFKDLIDIMTVTYMKDWSHQNNPSVQNMVIGSPFFVMLLFNPAEGNDAASLQRELTTLNSMNTLAEAIILQNGIDKFPEQAKLFT